jgi:hypothetical protein
MKSRRCRCRYSPQSPRCKESVIGHLKVRVLHPTGRKTWQTWWVCQSHLIEVQKAPRNWYAWRKMKGEISEARVIGLGNFEPLLS